MKCKLIALSLSLTCGGSAIFAHEIDFAYPAFSFDLFSRVQARIQAEDPSANVVLSPLSVWNALGMLKQGASDSTLDGICQTLGLSGEASAVMLNYDHDMLDLLTTPLDWYHYYDPKTLPVLEIANSCWVDDEISLLESYCDSIIFGYNAECFTDDLQQQSAMERVDEWVNLHTHGMIPSLNLEPETALHLLLVNTLFFQAGWSIPFRKDNTELQSFYPMNGEEEYVPMMSLSTLLDYYESDKFQVVRLYLFDLEKYSMTFYLPKAQDEILCLTKEDEELSINTFRSSGSSKAYVNLKLPRFEIGMERILNEELSQMGMSEAFSPSANFQAMSSEDPLSVSLIKQLARLEVAEYGVKASAATIVGSQNEGDPEPGPEPEWIDITFNRPFYFTLEDSQLHETFFIGQVNSLKENAGQDVSITIPSQQGEDMDESAYYDLMGMPHNAAQPGLNVLRKGGKSRLIMCR